MQDYSKMSTSDLFILKESYLEFWSRTKYVWSWSPIENEYRQKDMANFTRELNLISEVLKSREYGVLLA